MDKIDKVYNDSYKQIIEIYKKKQEKLKKEEEDLKSKLQTEVTKTKENLEIFLVESIEYISKNEKLKKSMEIFEKENEKQKNIYKQLNYVSIINKIT